MRSVSRLVAGLALCSVTSGCGLGGVLFEPRVQDVPRAEPTQQVAVIDCPPDGRGIDGVLPREERQPSAAPPDFVPTTVVICRADQRPGDGSERLFTITVERAALTAAVAEAVRLPDLQFDPRDEDDAACTADYQIKPYVLLVDDDHRGYRPALPLDPCGKLRPPVSKALAELTLTVQRTYKIRVPS